MTSHQLAKASLLAGLLRPDPIPIPRDEIGNFHVLLEKALVTCSPINIQNCKRWILNNIETKQRVAALAKYLVALVQSFNVPSPASLVPSTAATKPSGRRKALHVLYLINDVLHHTKYNSPDPIFAEEVKVFLPDLFTSAIFAGAVKQLDRLSNLLQLWAKKQYYDEAYINMLKELCVSASSNKASIQAIGSTQGIGAGGSNFLDLNEKKRVTAEKQLQLPAFHGDPSLPFFDLPAANMLPHIIPNSTTPINPRAVRPIQFPQTKPTEALQSAVRNFLKSVDAMFSARNIGDIESDAVGGIWGSDGEGYYGWSRTFCEKMKEKNKGTDEGRSVSSDGRCLSRRGSYSSEDSRDYSRDRRHKSISMSSRSRTRSRERDYRSRSRSRDRSEGTSRSASRSGNRSRNRGRNRSRSRSPTYSPRSPSSTYSPRPDSPRNVPDQQVQNQQQQQAQHGAQFTPMPQVNVPGGNFQGNLQNFLAAYSLPQQQFPFNPAAVPPQMNVQLPPHVQTTAMIQQMIIQQQLQQYGFSPNAVPPQLHPFLQQMQGQMQGQGFGAVGMQQWPVVAPSTMSYPGPGQQANPSNQQQSPPGQGQSPPGNGFGY